jgi:hypothetical protein
MTVGGEPVPPQTIEAGPGVRIVACEVSQRVLGLRRRARNGAVAVRRAAMLLGSVYIL